jgi:linoleoyl-CoA desaturase
METIKFTNSKTEDKDFAMALRKNVNEYFKTNKISTNANAAMVIKTIVLIAIYVVPFIVLVTTPVSLTMALILVIIMGIGIAGVGMGVMHDACHGSYSKKPWVNDMLSGTIYLLGSNIVNWKIQHNVLHHTYTNISGFDEDIDEKGPIRLSENTPLKWYHKYQFIYAFIFYGLMTLFLLFNDFMRLLNYNKKGLLVTQNVKISGELIKMFLRKTAYLLVAIGLPLWVTSFTWYQILTGFFIMHWVASIILSFVFQMAHVVEGADQPTPESEIKNNWYVHQFNTTSDFARNNKVLGWYVGGLNFQIEHHLFPNICHIHYPKIARIVEKTANDFGVKYNLKYTFIDAMASHITTLKELGSHTKLNHAN